MIPTGGDATHTPETPELREREPGQVDDAVGALDVALGRLGARRHALAREHLAIGVEDLPVAIGLDLFVQALEIDLTEALRCQGIAACCQSHLDVDRIAALVRMVEEERPVLADGLALGVVERVDLVLVEIVHALPSQRPPRCRATRLAEADRVAPLLGVADHLQRLVELELARAEEAQQRRIVGAERVALVQQLLGLDALTELLKRRGLLRRACPGAV